MPSATKTFKDQDSAIVIDEGYAPIYLVAWFGAPTEVTARAYFTWSTGIIEEAIRGSRNIVIIVDSEDAGRPTAKVRALMAELSEHMPRAEKLIAVFVALPNPLVRGAMTAMQWVTRKPWPMTVVSSLEEGLTRGLATLRAAGVGSPAGLDARTHLRLSRPA